jgi:sodium-coupled neutral amino acid transporter 9
MRILARFNVLGVACVFLMLAFFLASAIASGVSTDALSAPSLARPKIAILGTFALSFFIHSIAITIFRAAARPKDNTRNLSIAYALVTATYVGVGVSSNLCPPLGDADALDSAAGRNSFLSIRQPASLAVPLLLARIAVVVQCVTVYPVLIYAIRTQFFTALIYHKAYPGWRPVLVLNVVAIGASFAVIASGLHIADVIRFTGAFAALVCTYCIPARVHWKNRASRAAAHPAAHVGRIAVASSLVGFGCLIVAVQFIS